MQRTYVVACAYVVEVEVLQILFLFFLDKREHPIGNDVCLIPYFHYIIISTYYNINIF